MGADASPPRPGENFVRQWLECLRRTFGHKIDFPFASVRAFSGLRHEVCVPLLSYSHLDADEAIRLVARAPRRQVRHLAPLPPDAAPGTPVVSALPLRRWPDSSALWEAGLSGNLRKKIRRSVKEGVVVDTLAGPDAVSVFHPLFAATMHRHGTPPFPAALFRHALDLCDAEIHAVRRGAVTVAAYFVLFDPAVALFQWAGFDPRVDAGYASLLGEWSAIQSAIRRGCSWFDLGRAPLGSPAWRHKQYWHPVVYRAARMPRTELSIYHKYRLPAACWRRLPARLAECLGPRIMRHLPDA